jgi:hypothetical protein
VVALSVKAETINIPASPEGYIISQEVFLVAINSPLIEKYEPVGDGWCVSFVRAHGYEQYSGNAFSWWKYTDTDKPKVGGVVVLNESRAGHLALITDVASDSFEVVEQNYKGLYQISSRSIDFGYNKIVGFIKPKWTSASTTENTLKAETKEVQTIPAMPYVSQSYLNWVK